MTVRTIDLQTGEETTRDLTSEELDALKPSIEQVKATRIAELKSLLLETDYVALSDYDRERPDLIAQRQSWRNELRTFEK
jgi:hypothetical protein